MLISAHAWNVRSSVLIVLFSFAREPAGVPDVWMEACTVEAQGFRVYPHRRDARRKLRGAWGPVRHRRGAVSGSGGRTERTLTLLP